MRDDRGGEATCHGELKRCPERVGEHGGDAEADQRHGFADNEEANP